MPVVADVPIRGAVVHASVCLFVLAIAKPIGYFVENLSDGAPPRCAERAFPNNACPPA